MRPPEQLLRLESQFYRRLQQLSLWVFTFIKTLDSKLVILFRVSINAIPSDNYGTNISYWLNKLL